MISGLGSQALYVSYHGQTDGSDRGAVDEKTSANLDIIAAGGFVAQSVLGPVTPPAQLKELRAVAFGPDGLLWVVSGSSGTSQILRFQATRGPDGLHAFVDMVESAARLMSISHPFDIAFDPSAPQWFVSNQDTNVVVGPLAVGPPPLPTPSVAPYLQAAYPGVRFCPGTFVASAAKPLVECNQSQFVLAPQGLECIFDRDQQNSVRGLAHDGTLLYVADEAAGEVKSYDADGELKWQFGGGAGSAQIAGPVHLLLAAGGLFVGSSGTRALVFVPLSSGTDSFVVAQDINELSGIAIDASRTVYFGSRYDQQVYSVAFADGGAGSTPTAYGPSLPQAPEFVTLAPHGAQAR